MMYSVFTRKNAEAAVCVRLAKEAPQLDKTQIKHIVTTVSQMLTVNELKNVEVSVFDDPSVFASSITNTKTSLEHSWAGYERDQLDVTVLVGNVTQVGEYSKHDESLNGTLVEGELIHVLPEFDVTTVSVAYNRYSHKSDWNNNQKVAYVKHAIEVYVPKEYPLSDETVAMLKAFDLH